MTNRWNVLALLFCVRVTMAVQFQAVAALSPELMNQYGIGLADIGLLLGLYLSPGIIIALPGGAIAQWFGDKRTVAVGMVLMLLGSLMTLFLTSWEAQIFGRVLAGTGGVVLNVLMTKMIADWFASDKLATAMGIFVLSWPMGIAAALVVLPIVADGFGMFTAQTLVSISIAAGLIALLALYHDAPEGKPAPTSEKPEAQPVPKSKLAGKVLLCLSLAGVIWGLYNAALAMIFGFGPAVLIERDWGSTAASSATSIVLWLTAVSLPLGGVIADRVNRGQLVLFVGLVLFATGLVIVPLTSHIIPAFIWLGLISGLAAGPIMSLPSMVLTPENRARGMGLFFTIYYIAIFSGPTAGGLVADGFGTADAAIYLGCIMLVMCMAMQGAFLMLHRQMAFDQSSNSAQK